MNSRDVLIICLFMGLTGCESIRTKNDYSIIPKGNFISIKAGILERELNLENNNFTLSKLLIDSENIIQVVSDEFSFTLWKASPNSEPKGIEYSLQSGVEQQETVKNQTDALNIQYKQAEGEHEIAWIEPLSVNSSNFSLLFDSCAYKITYPFKGLCHLTIRFLSTLNTEWNGLSAEVHYELRDDFPAVRKWVTFSNQGKQWMKITNLTLEQLQMKEAYAYSTDLTPPYRGIMPSIIALHDPGSSQGVIMASEIPSRIRYLSEKGVAGYDPDYFEWVLGPSETFDSEPVFLYAFKGKSFPTISSVSTALDRCVENEFVTFLRNHIIKSFKDTKGLAPLFCSWTNYSADINDQNMREAADIASKIGFRCFQLDAGWSDTGPSSGWASSGRVPDLKKFPDLEDLSNYIRSKDMIFGLWYSVFRNEQWVNERKETGLFSLPLVRRSGGLGLSFTFADARESYAADIIYLHEKYKCNYFKQDLSNICYGDIAHNHESRTLKESYLRGLRGLFMTLDKIHSQAPEIFLQLSHEIYWETPGPSADIAVLKHADIYHIPPNEYWGAGNRSRRVDESWTFDTDSLKIKLLHGCLSARKLMYAHRGLPLEKLEVFAGVFTNFRGSLTPGIQNRQICSWLMGSPLSFAGDLGSLTEENIERYQTGFAILKKLQDKYKVYSSFQYSGVPAPTDAGWHWWGKLNAKGEGIVVILRGNEGPASQMINIPWVNPDKKYRVKTLFSDQNLGVFTGDKLINGVIKLSLDTYGQEIIEICRK